jgi:hypothetical protein
MKKIKLNVEVELNIDDYGNPIISNYDVSLLPDTTKKVDRSLIEDMLQDTRPDEIEADRIQLNVSESIDEAIEQKIRKRTSKFLYKKTSIQLQLDTIEESDRIHKLLSSNRSYPKRVTFKSRILDFVENNGGQATWKEIHNFMTAFKGYGYSCEENRGYGSAYFSGCNKSHTYRRGNSHCGIITRGSDNDPRHIIKEGKFWKLISFK